MSNDINDNNGVRLNVLKVAIFVFVASMVALGLYMLFKPKETYLQMDAEETMEIKYVACKTTKLEHSFFVPDSVPVSFSHNIKATYSNDDMRKLFYDYRSVYETEDAAEFSGSMMHADYNKYMAGIGVSSDTLSPNFTIDGKEVKISLYVDADKLEAFAAKMFFLNDVDLAEVMNYSPIELRDFYIKKGFSCE